MLSSIFPRLSGLFLASCLSGIALQAQAAQYEVTLLKPPTGSYATYAYALSNTGAVGYVEPFRAFGSQPAYWSLDGQGQLLPTLSPSTVRNSIHYAYNINNAGQIVGRSSTNLGVHAYLTEPDGRIKDLGSLAEGASSNAQSVNVHSAVVGESDTGSGLRAFLWTQDAGMKSLGVLPGGGFSSAHDINDGGAVVGMSQTAEGRRAFLWTADGGMQDLGDLAGGLDSSTAEHINNAGQVLGHSQTDDGWRAFLWTATDGMSDLGVLAGHLESFAEGLNASGVAVGNSRTANWVTKPFLWTAQGGMVDLNQMLLANDPLALAGLTLTGASDINDAGQILVSGLLNGRAVQAILTPVPEPSAILMALMGGGALACMLRRTRRVAA